MSLISVVIPLYNKEKYIQKTLNSILNQSFTDFEVIIINDGSTDNSLAIVQAFIDNRITIINTENKGVSSARNQGVKNAKSTLIAFLDADDVWEKNHLENLINLQQQYPNKAIFASAYSVMIKGNKRDFFIKKPFNNPIDFFNYSLNFSLLNSSNILLDKAVFDTIGYFNSDYKGGEDTDFWIRLGLKYSLCFSNEIALVINKSIANQASEILNNYDNAKYLLSYQTAEKSNLVFNKYMDYQRYGLIMRYKKLAKSHPNEKELLHLIDKQNLSVKQRLFLFLPNKIVSLISAIV